MKDGELMATKHKFYRLDKINKYKATYNVIFGERSNGKTYALLEESLRRYFIDKSQMAYVRRWKEDIIGKRASGIWNAVNVNGLVEKYSNGEFTGVHYYASRFYLCNYDENGKAIYHDSNVLGHTFALSDGEHNKSISFPHINTIMFDEFLTSKLYLQDEFVHFMNTVSTIVRKREGVKIYLLGNTVNRYSPYFNEMGLKHILKMEQGTIDIYKYGNSKLTVAVEYCADTSTTKDSNHYFAFDNPKLEMITSGAWELNMYPHLPYKYKPKDVLFTYFIEYNDQLFQAEIVSLDEITFTYIHVKTTEIKNPDTDLIYTLDYIPKMNHNRSILKPINQIQEKVLWYFKTGRVFYQDNEVGDTIANFIKSDKKGGV
jgi:hypothetical protein